MSSTHALASGILASTSNARQSSASSSVDRNDTGFRDALDKESRSRETKDDSGRSQETARAHDSKDYDSKKTKEDGGEDTAARDSDCVNPSCAETPVAGDLSAILAQLSNGKPGDRASDSLNAPADQKADANSLAPLVDDVGPVMPDDGSDSLDAEKLMALLKSGLPNSSGDGAVDKVDLKVKVAGQETHLALAPQQPGENSEMLVAEQANAEAQGVVKSQGEGAGKTQVKAANEAQNTVRAPAQDNDTNSPPDMKDAARAKSVGEQWSERSGAALSDHGIAGGDGRQSDGRGASSGGNSQQGSNAFMSLLASVSSQAASAAQNSVGAETVADPVMDQIADGVRAELRADGLLDSSSEGVVKVLSIELKPANLGAVTVRIALKDNTVKVHIEAQRGETLAVIERERDALESALKSAGYSVDSISAAPQGELSRGLGVSPAAAPDAGAQQGGLSGQASQGQGLGESGQQGQSGHGGSGRSEPGPRPDAKDTNAQGVRAGNNGLYV
jgi:flagellar hook-length control protein FliK